MTVTSDLHPATLNLCTCFHSRVGDPSQYKSGLLSCKFCKVHRVTFL